MADRLSSPMIIPTGLALAGLALFDVVTRAWQLPHSAIVPVAVVIALAYRGGMRGGLVGTALVLGYAAMFWAPAGDSLAPGDTERFQWIVLSVVVPVSALLVGGFKEHVDRLAARGHATDRAGAEADRDLSTVAGRMERVLARSVDMICSIDEDARFAFVSPASETLLGYAPHEMVGRLVKDFIHPDDVVRTEEAAAQLHEGRGGRDVEHRLVRKDGTFVDVAWAGAWSPDDRLYFSVARDITARRRAEEERDRAREMVRTLKGLLPMCAWCSSVRQEDGSWSRFDSYIESHTDAQVTHGMCPACLAARYPEE